MVFLVCIANLFGHKSPGSLTSFPLLFFDYPASKITTQHYSPAVDAEVVLFPKFEVDPTPMPELLGSEETEELITLARILKLHK